MPINVFVVISVVAAVVVLPSTKSLANTFFGYRHTFHQLPETASDTAPTLIHPHSLTHIHTHIHALIHNTLTQC